MKIRAAVIGVGYLGSFHAQKYKALSQGPLAGQLELVGVCDLKAAQAQKVAQELGVSAYTDPKDLVGKVDAVTIATMTPAHFEMAKFFLNNGVHVNIEKPITETVAEAEQLVAIAKQKGLTTAVGHSERFNPAFQYLYERRDGTRYCEMHRHAPFKLRGSDVSVIHDLMIHDLDLALALGPGEPELVFAQAGCVVTKTYDWASCVLQFKNGLKVLITTSRLAPAMTRQVKAFYDQQTITANLQTGDVEILSNQLAEQGQLQVQTVSAGKGDNLMLETEAFIQALLNKRAPPITGQDGLRALRVAEEVIARVVS